MDEKTEVKSMSFSLDTVIENYLQSRAAREDRKISAVVRRILYDEIARERLAEVAEPARPEPTP